MARSMAVNRLLCMTYGDSATNSNLNDHRDLDHPFERILVDTAAAPDPTAVSWIDPRLAPGETPAS